MALLNDQNQFTLFFLTKSAKKSRFSRGPLEAKMAKFWILSSPTASPRVDLPIPEETISYKISKGTPKTNLGRGQLLPCPICSGVLCQMSNKTRQKQAFYNLQFH